MKRKLRNPEQIIRKLRDADRMLSEGKDIALVCQSLEVSEATFHRWRNQYGGMKADEAKRLKELQIENARLKKGGAPWVNDEICPFPTEEDTPREERYDNPGRNARGHTA